MLWKWLTCKFLSNKSVVRRATPIHLLHFGHFLKDRVVNSTNFSKQFWHNKWLHWRRMGTLRWFHLFSERKNTKKSMSALFQLDFETQKIFEGWTSRIVMEIFSQIAPYVYFNINSKQREDFLHFFASFGKQTKSPSIKSKQIGHFRSSSVSDS